MGFLSGKRILITGLLSSRSIAYGIAQACKREGADLAFTYVGDRFRERITEFAAEFGSTLVYPCDVGDDAQIDALFHNLKPHWDGLDGLVHSIGFAPREAIAGDFLDGLSRESFRTPTDEADSGRTGRVSVTVIERPTQRGGVHLRRTCDGKRTAAARTCSQSRRDCICL